MYEYMVIEAPAPARRGWFRKQASYADTLSRAINEVALEKWEFQRAETGLDGRAKLLVFRKEIEKAKASEEMREPRSFSDRLLEAEHKTKRDDPHHEPGRDYSGPIRPRRARVILDNTGTMTERPE